MKHLANIQRQAQNRIMAGEEEGEAIIKKWIPIIEKGIVKLFRKEKFKIHRIKWGEYRYDFDDSVSNDVTMDVDISGLDSYLEGVMKITDDEDCSIYFDVDFGDDLDLILDGIEIEMELDFNKMKIKRSEMAVNFRIPDELK